MAASDGETYFCEWFPKENAGANLCVLLAETSHIKKDLTDMAIGQVIAATTDPGIISDFGAVLGSSILDAVYDKSIDEDYLVPPVSRCPICPLRDVCDSPNN